jgi:hypothetical protein
VFGDTVWGYHIITCCFTKFYFLDGHFQHVVGYVSMNHTYKIQIFSVVISCQVVNTIVPDVLNDCSAFTF